MKSLACVSVGLGLLITQFGWNTAAEADWEFQPDHKVDVAWRLPSSGVTGGRLNVAGTFVPNPLGGDSSMTFAREVMSPSAINDPQENIKIVPYHQEERVYEFRSGSLVLGILRFPGTFLPTVGKPVIWIDDYKPTKDGKPAPRIYNLPGKMVKVPAGRQPKQYQEPPRYEAGSDWERDGKVHPQPENTREYKEDLTRRVGLLRGKVVFIGRLDAKGEFTPDLEVKPVAYTKEPTVVIDLPGGKNERVPVINHPVVPYDTVYEYKSNWLLHGTLREGGAFVPTEGGVRLVSFFFSAPDDGTRIYNLPGEIVRVGPKKK